MAAESKTKHYVNVFLRYFVLILVGLIMIYPLVWMVGATFKSNAEIFSSIGFIPKNPTLEGYKGNGELRRSNQRMEGNVKYLLLRNSEGSIYDDLCDGYRLWIRPF